MRLILSLLVFLSLFTPVVSPVHAEEKEKPSAQSEESPKDKSDDKGESDKKKKEEDKATTDPNETFKQLNLFGDVFERVRAQYVDEVSDKKLIEYAINGMLTSLDPHSAYLNEDDFDDMRVQTKGEFGGLGIEVTMDSGLIKVVSPIDDTPAAKAGVKAGDYITHLDKKPIMGMTLAEAVDQMRGKVGTPIEITLRREGVGEPINLKIVRDVIKIQSVRSRLEDDIGYLRITQFNQNTESGLEDAIKKLKKDSDGKIVGYILDLRNNPGGLLDQAIAVSDAFLEKGEIVSTRGRDPKDIKRDNATAGDLTDGKPITILINGGSASASEIVSGALQDHRRAIVLGTRSFGKGSVQTLIPLPGNGAMRLTTARYYTPSGRSIQAKGIDPDITVEPARIEKLEDTDIHEEDLKGALENPDGEKPKVILPTQDENPAPSTDVKADEKKLSPKELEKKRASEDYQLQRAIDLLHGLSLYGGQHEDAKVKAPAAAPAKDTDKKAKD